jgi:hypothetical protein
MPSTHRSLANLPLPPGPPRPPRDLSALAPDTAAPDPSLPEAVAGIGSPLSFELKAAPFGVHVLRVHRRDDGTRLYCSVLFDDEAEFLEWLDVDPVRYTHPLVFQQARRCFAQLMARRDPHDAVRR